MALRSELDPITISFQEKFSQSKSFYDIVKWYARQEVTSNFCENHLSATFKVSGDPSPRVEWWRESMEGKEIATLVSS